MKTKNTPSKIRAPVISSSQNFYAMPAHEIATFGSNSPLAATDQAFTFERPRQSSRELITRAPPVDTGNTGRNNKQILTQRATDQSPVLTGGKRNMNRDSRGSENRNAKKKNKTIH